MTKKFNRGFTLIELLVVIAIIGILSSIVLASLNTARGKGADAAVKSDLDNMRAQAELNYDTNGQTYAGICTDPIIVQAMANAHTNSGATTADTTAFGTAEATTNGACQPAAQTWVIQYPLKGAGAGNYWCVDNSGNSKLETAVLAASSVKCL